MVIILWTAYLSSWIHIFISNFILHYCQTKNERTFINNFEETIKETLSPNLFIISAAAIPPNPTELIGKEDKSRPLSDDKLEKSLKAKGYNIARRTVAKYREQLNIPVARLRKEL